MNNYSRQREAILEVIKENLIHPTAEEIYRLVTKKYPQISKSTVYRNINILVELGEIKKIKATIGPDKYDYPYRQHSHIICEKCGKIYDLYYNFNNKNILKELTQQEEVKFDINNIIVYGICEKCKSKNI